MEPTIVIITILLSCFSLFCLLSSLVIIQRNKRDSIKHMKALIEAKLKITEIIEEAKNHHIQLTEKEEFLNKYEKEIKDILKPFENLRKTVLQNIVDNSQN